MELAVIDQIEAQNAAGTGAYFDNYRELVPQTFNPAQFYLTPEGLTVYFQQYDIAPYASGFHVPSAVPANRGSPAGLLKVLTANSRLIADRVQNVAGTGPMRNDCRRRRAA